MYYAKYDFTTNPQNAGNGFANSKKCYAFYTKKDRNNFISYREDFDFSCKAITRREALSFAFNLNGIMGKGVEIFNSDSEYSHTFLVMTVSKMESLARVGMIV